MNIKNYHLFTIFLIVFIDLLGFRLILALLPYIAEAYGANAIIVDLIIAILTFLTVMIAYWGIILPGRHKQVINERIE